MQANFHIFLTYLTKNLNPITPIENTIVKKALVLFRQEQVHNVVFESPNLYGSVAEVKIYHASLNIYDPHKSRCSCESKGLCEHKLALFFYYFSQFSSVSTLIDDWKNSQISKSSYSNQFTEPLEQSYEKWTFFFKEKILELFPNENAINKYNFQRLQTSYDENIKVHEPLEYEWAMLYKTIAYFTALKHIWSFIENGISTQLDQQIFTRFKMMIHQYSQSPIFFQADKFHASLLLGTRSEVFKEPSFSSTKWQVFRLLWSSRLSTVKQRVEEIQILKENPKSTFNTWALVHLYFTNKEDLDAINSLKSTNNTHIENISVLFDEFISKKEYIRALPIADWIIKEHSDFLKPLSSNELSIRIISKQIRIITQESNRFDLLEKFYKDYLPSTSKDYLTFLFNQKSYTKWLELLFISQQGNLMFYFDDIKTIEITHPEITIPFYHREIYLLISQKDRASYRQASRLLHHLREIYNNCNRESEWNLFLNHLIEKNRRLRAFQDELKRWNLYVSSSK
ncbi:MAG: zinc finger family protein [Bacillales bacterium]|jgi:hypothetical protein|nr:zinc finger family protein [Bacillales bacterium]